MEKISRILPASPRLTAVDLKSSGATRPGAPSFGRPVGVSALATPKFDGMARAVEELKEFQVEREPTFSKDPKVEIVEKISREFFSTAPKSAESAETAHLTDEILAHYHDDNSDLNPMTSKRLDADLGEDAPVVGGQLDVVA